MWVFCMGVGKLLGLGGSKYRPSGGGVVGGWWADPELGRAPPPMGWVKISLVLTLTKSPVNAQKISGNLSSPFSIDIKNGKSAVYFIHT